jgi:hypothetical protein
LIVGLFADEDRYPYQQDWSIRPAYTLSSDLHLGDGSTNCPYVVKVRAWAPELAKCGLSLDSVCIRRDGSYSVGATPYDSGVEAWSAWKQDVRNIGPDCAALLRDLEVCCDLMDYWSPAARHDDDSWLRLIPFSDFRKALFDCVE